jgi:hypothetical protein
VKRPKGRRQGTETHPGNPGRNSRPGNELESVRTFQGENLMRGGKARKGRASCPVEENPEGAKRTIDPRKSDVRRLRKGRLPGSRGHRGNGKTLERRKAQESTGP